MTCQTCGPIERLKPQNTCRTARELVRLRQDGLMTADLSHQRGRVWAPGQRMELIRSWPSGTPAEGIGRAASIGRATSIAASTMEG